MKRFRDFSYKLLCCMLVLFCHIYSLRAFGESVQGNASPSGSNQAGANLINASYDNLVNTGIVQGTTPSVTQTVCPSGYYVSKCGSYEIGTNWLKGMNIISNSETIKTTDYYSYNVPSADAINIANLRKFFAAIEPITYYEENAGTNGTRVNPGDTTGYKVDRDTILENFCINETGNLLNTKCERCPNNAEIAGSTVTLISITDAIIPTSWNIHTIADCYMKEFSDDTGTYVYIPENVVASDTEVTSNCYYSKEVPGSMLQ